MGFILGGLLTERLDGRWTFFVSIPFAVIAAAGAYLVIREPSGSRNRAPLDIPGVALPILGPLTPVYAVTRAASEAGATPRRSAAGGRLDRYGPAQHRRRLGHDRVHQGPQAQQRLVPPEGQAHGCTNAIWFTVGALVLAATIAFTFVTIRQAGSRPGLRRGGHHERGHPIRRPHPQ